ncbi:L-asparaginase II [Inhella inkyongensis]|uniref:L-asparaginase II n=1 Tax=Inhella inkyongensis TaxID=392593 RepID=A0A840S3K0_9BURK|nr:asparaginase [Inhella inkyongensis]MBB5204915.1 L-asparaginase II [Inhella inkyongensis]
MSFNPVMVQAWRGPAVESEHRGALAVVDADGALVLGLGDIERAIFPRSAVKALQALPLVASGAAERFALSDAELAQACASHGGEPAHVATTAGLLTKLGLEAEVLECGAHWPRGEAQIAAMGARGETPTALHNNCSGKHAGFVCLGCVLAGEADRRQFLRGYVEPEHPVMREVTAALAAATATDLSRAPVGIDGCSIPTYAIPLRQLALGFARLGTGQGLSTDHAQAAQRLRRAVAAQPFHVAGTNRLDTVLMQALGERLFCKVGAEGVYCAALPERGWGLAIKMDDGNTARAVEVVLAAVVQAALPLNDADQALLQRHSELSLRNWNQRLVGRLAATPALRQALGPLARG